MSTGSTIKELRTRKGWTQRQLASKAGVSAQLIANYEKDKINPTVKTFEKVLNAMGWTLIARKVKEQDHEKLNGNE